MLQQSAGIILTQYPFGETSLVVHVYTLEYGILSMLTNGVRKAKSRQKPSNFL
ncbi:MAG: Recombination protein terminal, partial [Bacteroidota bacterium]